MDSKLELVCLPPEIIIKICLFLKLSDLRNLMLTCKSIKDLLLNESMLWRLMAQRSFITIKNKSFRDSKSWYDLCRIYRNWCKGIYFSQVIIQHTSYMPWLHLSKSERLFLSLGSKLRCYVLNRNGIPKKGLAWSFEVPIVKRHDIRTNDISRFIVKDNFIVCGNRDGCVAVYQLNENQRKPYLLAHIKDCHENGRTEVTAVEKVGNAIVTVSDKSDTICFWSIAEQESGTQNYTDPLSYVNYKTEYRLPKEIWCKCVAVNKAEDTLALGSVGYDSPMIIDVNAGALKRFFTSPYIPYKVIRDIHWLNEHCVAYVTHSGKLCITDIRSSNVVYDARDPFTASLYCLKTDGNNIIVTGTAEFTRCVLYDLRSTHHYQMYFTQKKSSPVYCLDFNSSKLVAAADRGVVTVNFNTTNSIAKDYSPRFQ